MHQDNCGAAIGSVISCHICGLEKQPLIELLAFRKTSATSQLDATETYILQLKMVVFY